MEIAFIILTSLVVLFAMLAIYDGFYLHLFKYQLHNQATSKNEHLTHTIRAVLFPAIVYTLFLQQNSNTCFYLGLLFVSLDIIVLGIDAFMEKDSRVFMGGLPRWEYILHLFVNGFHFASIAVFLTVKLDLTQQGIVIVQNFYAYENFKLFQFVAQNLLPGSILMAILHVALVIPTTATPLNTLRSKIMCC